MMQLCSPQNVFAIAVVFVQKGTFLSILKLLCSKLTQWFDMSDLFSLQSGCVKMLDVAPQIPSKAK